jgi:hypothetical protein
LIQDKEDPLLTLRSREKNILEVRSEYSNSKANKTRKLVRMSTLNIYVKDNEEINVIKEEIKKNQLEEFKINIIKNDQENNVIYLNEGIELINENDESKMDKTKTNIRYE